MKKSWLRILVLMMFMCSTVQGIAAVHAVPFHHQAVEQEQAFSQHTVHPSHSGHSSNTHASYEGAVDHVFDDQTLFDVESQTGDKECCDSDCQCQMSSCAKVQTLHSLQCLSYMPAFIKMVFASYDAQLNSNIVYLLKKPPRI